jgi:hypothetical protein
MFSCAQIIRCRRLFIHVVNSVIPARAHPYVLGRTNHQHRCGGYCMARQKLSPQGQRLRIIILTVPIMAATSGLQNLPSLLRRSCSHISSQWCSTNASCSENPSASSRAPESPTQTVKSSSFATKTQKMTAESGGSRDDEISNPPAQSVPYVHKSIYLVGVLLVIIILPRVRKDGRSGERVILPRLAGVGPRAHRRCVLG